MLLSRGRCFRLGGGGGGGQLLQVQDRIIHRLSAMAAHNRYREENEFLHYATDACIMLQMHALVFLFFGYLLFHYHIPFTNKKLKYTMLQMHVFVVFFGSHLFYHYIPICRSHDLIHQEVEVLTQVAHVKELWGAKKRRAKGATAGSNFTNQHPPQINITSHP